MFRVISEDPRLKGLPNPERTAKALRAPTQHASLCQLCCRCGVLDESLGYTARRFCLFRAVGWVSTEMTHRRHLGPPLPVCPSLSLSLCLSPLSLLPPLPPGSLHSPRLQGFGCREVQRFSLTCCQVCHWRWSSPRPIFSMQLSCISAV